MIEVKMFFENIQVLLAEMRIKKNKAEYVFFSQSPLWFEGSDKSKLESIKAVSQ